MFARNGVGIILRQPFKIDHFRTDVTNTHVSFVFLLIQLYLGEVPKVRHQLWIVYQHYL